ncbi:MAG: SDR family oxidoreductase [Lachnospiraceae bacterium]|nr:SDR family oxidoreductase [Lachnospiraceae bacterium]
MRNKFMNKWAGMVAAKRPIYVNPIFPESGKGTLDGKTAVVIGGGGGIGAAISRELKDAGCRVIVCGRRPYDMPGMESEIWDVSKTEEIASKVSELIEKYEKIDIVVNSQGICPDPDFTQSFYKVDIEDFENVFKTNLESVYFICQEICRYFEANNIKGHILNICSTEGMRGNKVPYGLTKTALIAFTKGLGKEMARKGIVINGIAPGATATEMMRKDENGDVRSNWHPTKRMTVPAEIGKAALFLIQDTGNQMVGQVLVVDGGESMC